MNDHVEKFQSMNENQVVVKGVVKMDERAELILAYLFLFMSNERKKIHIEWNGKIEITSTFDGFSHTCRCTSEIKNRLQS